MKLDDPSLDAVDAATRDLRLTEALRDQLAFMRESVPFWRERLEKAGVDERSIGGTTDLARIPILSKQEFRAMRPADLLPRERRRELQVGRWTSGTSGRPTANFWSASDWAAVVASAARVLARQAPLRGPVAFNGYSQAHVTGPFYDGALRSLGGVVFDRSHHPEELFSTLAQLELFEFDTLVLPARAVKGKGIGVADLLEQAPDVLARHGVRWWIGGSGTFDAQTMAAARRQAVEAISNLYGSSEFGPFALSCASVPGDYHVAQGHVYVEVVDAAGAPVRSGGTGRVVVTHLSGMDERGTSCVHTGTQLLRLAPGDGATLVTEACDCGLTTPRLRGVRRIDSEATAVAALGMPANLGARPSRR